MLRSLYTAATGMEAQQLRMDLIAHNLANTSTTGFKRERAEFEDLIADTIRTAAPSDPRGGGAPAPLEVGLGVGTGATTRSMTQGELSITNNPLDFAIEGSGYFRVQRPDGAFAYTRAGDLRVDAQGRLTTQRGELLEPAITLPADATSFTVKPDGEVWCRTAGREEDTQLGRLELAVFQNPGGLTSLGSNLFASTAASGEPLIVRPGEQSAGTLAQGALEGSNVKAVEEMIDMISTQRAYEMNSKVIQTADQMLQRLTTLR